MEAKLVLPVGLNAGQQLAAYSDHVLNCNSNIYPESNFSTRFKHLISDAVSGEQPRPEMTLPSTLQPGSDSSEHGDVAASISMLGHLLTHDKELQLRICKDGLPKL